MVVTSGDVTTISSTPAPDGSGDAVAAGGEAIAASLSPDGEVLNVAFMTGDGHAQIIQLRVSDLTRAREAARAGEPGTGAQAGSDDVIVIKGDLSTVSEAAIAANGGAATSVVGISVAAELGEQGRLSLTFVDGNGDLQLVETNVAALVA